jgi:putative oxidoreductase
VRARRRARLKAREKINDGRKTVNRMNAALARVAPYVLSVLRIVVGLLFLQHGLVKLFAFPMPFPNPPAVGTLIWYQGIIEIIGGPLVILGFLTRPVAFILAGDMAFAYFIGHAGRSIYPIQNAGNLAILYCFVFLYLTFAGPGPWSIDARGSKEPSDA